MKKFKFIYTIYLIPLIILLSCENNVTLETEYNNFSGYWAQTFRWSDGTTSTGTYFLRNDGNVDCTGENCSENNSNYSLVSRNWISTGDKITITLKYTELNNNNRLVTGIISGSQFSKDRISGTLSYSIGSHGTWTAQKDSTSTYQTKELSFPQNDQLPF